MPPISRPLGRRAYGSIPHLPGSRVGPSDRHLDLPRARRCTERQADARDRVIVLEKLDGSCVAVAREGGQLLALGREGDLAERSANEARRMFAAWVSSERVRLLEVLADGERLVGEWLALAHSTRYQLSHDPFVPFDLMREDRRAPFDRVLERASRAGLVTPGLVHDGGPLSVADALARLGKGLHGALDPVEGAVWRLERRLPGGDRVELLAKFVRPEKRDGALLPEVTGLSPVWNWRPPSLPVSPGPRSPWVRGSCPSICPRSSPRPRPALAGPRPRCSATTPSLRCSAAWPLAPRPAGCCCEEAC